MTSTKIFSNIKNNPYFLLQTYVVEFLVFTTLILVLPKTGILAMTSIFQVIPAIILGLLVASFIHNASHNNIKNKSLNRAIGEYCGAWSLYGFSNFVMIHMLHHRFSDTEQDPVNPTGKSFLVFLFAPMRFMIKVAIKWLCDMHGQNKSYNNILAAQTVFFHLNLIVKLMLWYKLFGAESFVLFYLPSLFAVYAVHAHINFICHREMENGEVEILNLDHNVYYKVVNFITIGGYYHKNHHEDLKLFNPQRLRRTTRTSMALSGLSVTEA